MKEDHWTYQLFLRRPELFLAIHETGLKYAESQVERLEQILGRLGISRGSRLLDAPCGIGRHSVHFALRGWKVVGVELVPEYVERGKQLAAELGVSPQPVFRVGDLREVGTLLKDEEPFNGILNLLTSLGYWDDMTDLSILNQFHQLAAPDGVLLLDTINKDYVVQHFQPRSFEEYGDIAYVDERNLDLQTSRIRSKWTFYKKEGKDLRHAFSVDTSQRIYGPHELKGLLEEAGWGRVKVFSGWDLRPLSSTIYRLLAIGRK
ncbi:MAG: class I SAM-dependent methyltransferase [Thermoplasmata archaeon]